MEQAKKAGVRQWKTTTDREQMWSVTSFLLILLCNQRDIRDIAGGKLWELFYAYLPWGKPWGSLADRETPAQGFLMFSLSPYHSQTVRRMNPAPLSSRLPPTNISRRHCQILEQYTHLIKGESIPECKSKYFCFALLRCINVSWTLICLIWCSSIWSQITSENPPLTEHNSKNLNMCDVGFFFAKLSMLFWKKNILPLVTFTNLFYWFNVIDQLKV